MAASSNEKLARHRASWQPAFAKELARRQASWQPALLKSWHTSKQAGSQLFQKTGTPPSKLAASFRKKAGTPASKLAASSFEKLARHQASWPASTKRHVQHFRAEQHIGKFFVSLHALLVEVVVHLLSSAKVSTPHLQANIFKIMAEKTQKPIILLQTAHLLKNDGSTESLRLCRGASPCATFRIKSLLLSTSLHFWKAPWGVFSWRLSYRDSNWAAHSSTILFSSWNGMWSVERSCDNPQNCARSGPSFRLTLR